MFILNLYMSFFKLSTYSLSILDLRKKKIKKEKEKKHLTFEIKNFRKFSVFFVIEID